MLASITIFKSLLGSIELKSCLNKSEKIFLNVELDPEFKAKNVSTKLELLNICNNSWYYSINNVLFIFYVKINTQHTETTLNIESLNYTILNNTINFKISISDSQGLFF